MSPILGIWASAQQPALNASSFESIATVTVGSGGAANIEFTSIPSTYTHLQIRYIARGGGTQDYGQVTVNSDTGNNYARHTLYGDGSSTGTEAAANTSRMYVGEYAGSGASANIYGVGVFDFLDYANTNKYKTMRFLGGDDRNGSGQVVMRSGVWMNTNAITSIKVTSENGNFVQYSSFALYGIKGA